MVCTMKLLNFQYENKITLINSIEDEERLSNLYSIGICGASVIPAVLRLNVILGVILH